MYLAVGEYADFQYTPVAAMAVKKRNNATETAERTRPLNLHPPVPRCQSEATDRLCVHVSRDDEHRTSIRTEEPAPAGPRIARLLTA
jgi:hypothetical protein